LHCLLCAFDGTALLPFLLLTKLISRPTCCTSLPDLEPTGKSSLLATMLQPKTARGPGFQTRFLEWPGRCKVGWCNSAWTQAVTCACTHIRTQAHACSSAYAILRFAHTVSSPYLHKQPSWPSNEQLSCEANS